MNERGHTHHNKHNHMQGEEDSSIQAEVEERGSCSHMRVVHQEVGRHSLVVELLE